MQVSDVGEGKDESIVETKQQKRMRKLRRYRCREWAAARQDCEENVRRAGKSAQARSSSPKMMNREAHNIAHG